MTYQPEQYEVSGFELYGERQDDGTILLGFGPNRKPMDDFPKTVELTGSVYILEFVRPNKVSEETRQRVGTERADKAERICWGVYV